MQSTDIPVQKHAQLRGVQLRPASVTLYIKSTTIRVVNKYYAQST